ncbi:methyl-accepting chemotaxis protein TlpC [Halanaerocella petrolearia]
MSSILLRLRNLSIKFKLVLLFLVSLLILVSITLFIVRMDVIEQATQVAVEKVQTDLQTSYEILDSKYSGNWRLEGDKLYKGNQLMNKNYEIVDLIGELTGDTVTIFANNIRVATNVTDKDGERAIGTTVSDDVAQTVLNKGKDFYGKANVVGNMYQTAYTPIKNSQGDIIGIWYVGAPQGFVDKMVRSIFIKVGVVILIVALFLSVYVFYMSNKIVTPILKALDFAEQISEGDLNGELNINSGDEIGQLGQKLNKMKENIKHMIIQIGNSIEEITAYSEELSALAEEGYANIETTNGLIQGMLAGIQEISASSEEVASYSEKSNSQTSIGSQNIQQTVNSIEEINKTVDETVEVINKLDDNSEEIGHIVELITNIAEQTNLLALNASIEAARAGEHGQGFTVVAEEIRQLATRTTKATDQITNLVNQTQKYSKKGIEKVKKVEVRAREGKGIVEQTSKVFEKIEKDVERTSLQMEQTASSTSDLAQSSNEIITATEDISNMSNEVTTSSEKLAEMAQELERLVEQFKL